MDMLRGIREICGFQIVMMKSFFLWVMVFGGEVVLGGPFAPAAGVVGSDAVAADDLRFVQWAAGGFVVRGRAFAGAAVPVDVTYGSIEDAFGPADATVDEPFPVVSLGDGGSATLTFAKPIQDVPGADFVVFENGFMDSFLELAHVEVSSDGENFFRFPSVSLTQTESQLGNFSGVDPTKIYNLAGKYRAGFGVPFDLGEMRILFPELDVNRVTHVRVVDVVGSIDPAFGSQDSLGNLINDPYPTNFDSGGFDLDAVGAFSVLPGSFAEWLESQGRVDVSPGFDAMGLGVPQVVEFMTGGSNLEVMVTGEGVVVEFDWLSYREGVSFWMEGSEDLENWQRLATSLPAQDFHPGPGAVVEVLGTGGKKRVRVVVLGGYRFFRLGAAK